MACEELAGDAQMFLQPKTHFTFRSAYLTVDDMKHLTAAKNYLGHKRQTRAFSPETAYATDTIIYIATCFIMKNLDSSKHLFFMLHCYAYTSWEAKDCPKKFTVGGTISNIFPWGYQKCNLLKTRCISFPFSESEHYSVMFVLNVDSLLADKEIEGGSVPVIYYFDSLPSKPNRTLTKKLRFVYGLLNSILDKSRSSKTTTGETTNKSSLIFDKTNLPLIQVPLTTQPDSFSCGYNIIRYIGVMYNQVVHNEYKGDGVKAKDISKSMLATCNDHNRTLPIVTDLIKLGQIVYNTSLAEETIKPTSTTKKRRTICSSDSDFTITDSSDSDTEEELEQKKIPQKNLRLTRLKKKVQRKRKKPKKKQKVCDGIFPINDREYIARINNEKRQRVKKMDDDSGYKLKKDHKFNISAKAMKLLAQPQSVQRKPKSLEHLLTPEMTEPKHDQRQIVRPIILSYKSKK